MDGDATNPREHELVENLGWVQRLALSLARDRDAADDLAQDVARVWLEKRPVLSDGPRGWLAAVARKLAIDRARAELSRKAREQSAAKPEGESYEVVERGARQRRVVEAVMQLAEPYRSSVLYRYLDGLSTREVAERMNTNEATVRKRLERGLALLRERLDREFGSNSNNWALLLLEPGLRSAIFKGVGIMSLKWSVAAGVVALLAGAAWYVHGNSAAGSNEPVGGTGVVVPLEVAAAREKQAPVDTSKLENADAGQRAVVKAAPASASMGPSLRGFIYIDDEHRAPEDLRIERKGDENRTPANAHVDSKAATWSLDKLGGKPGRLWISSNSTVPALIPVPPELWETGGVFDLHLSAGRTLDLTFLDRETKQPLPNLEFQVQRSVEIERTRGRVTSEGVPTIYHTDAQGKALVLGVPRMGSISVTVDFANRQRDVVMGNGSTSRMGIQHQPDWQAWLKSEQPTHMEQTILVSPPLGEACASGQVPAWAVKLAGGTAEVRVLARETTNESPQGRGFPFLLSRDDQDRFELCSNAPNTLAVWLEKTSSRERISAETALTFSQPGAQDPIVFRELQGKKVALRFVHVPERGTLQAWTVGKGGMNSTGNMKCQGADFTHEYTLAEGEQIQLSLRLGSEPSEKSGWTKLLAVADEREITVDLGGSERKLRIESTELGALDGDGSIGLLRVENGEAIFDQSIVVLCSAGLGSTPVHIPNGRWLYRYDDKNQIAVWGVVEVTTAAQPSDELVLRPRLRLAPLAEIQPGIRFDEIEGVSLAKLPEKFRMASAKGGSERVALPIDAKYVMLDLKK